MVGRVEESAALEAAYSADESEFVAVYGRRRVGKTYLVSETFRGKFSFRHAGLKDATMREQLESFRESLVEFGHSKCPELKGWLQAFHELEVLLSRKKAARKVVFIDEMPWMDTPKSGFLTALESFWNKWACSRKDIVFVICGSATSWIVKKVLRSRGGLHNRVTRRIKLFPFTLAECEEFVNARRLGMDRRQIAECYMAFGGVAYYWSLLEKGKSAAQNFDALFFGRQDGLRREYFELYSSLFRNEEPYQQIVTVLAKGRRGMTREEIVKRLGNVSGGNVTRELDELEECGFIRRYQIPGSKVKGAIFQLVDHFTLFHFSFLDGDKITSGDFWSSSAALHRKEAWRGLAFERLCLEHVRQIKFKLGISGVFTREYAWRGKSDGNSHEDAQIDLVLDRNDDTVNLCEMKYCAGGYRITASEDAAMARRKRMYSEFSGSKKALHVTFVTSDGLVPGKYNGNVQSEVTLDDLFRA